MAGPISIASCDSANSGVADNVDIKYTKYTFHLTASCKAPLISEKEVNDYLLKWGLRHSLFRQIFIFDQILKEYEYQTFFDDFILNKECLRTLELPNGCYFPHDIDKMVIEPLTCTITDMSFFKKLCVEPNSNTPGIIKRSGDIVGCYDECYEEIYISDELRKFLISDESDNADLFSQAEMNEFIFRIFKHICLGGHINQYEDRLQPYLDATLALYKSLIKAGKEEHTNAIKTLSKVFSLKGYLKNELVFPSPHEHTQNFCYAIITPSHKSLSLFYHIWK